MYIHNNNYYQQSCHVSLQKTMANGRVLRGHSEKNKKKTCSGK